MPGGLWGPPSQKLILECLLYLKIGPSNQTRSVDSYYRKMKACAGLLCCLALAASVANADEVEVTPVQKVITLLNGMLEKGKKEKHDEQVQNRPHHNHLSKYGSL